MTNLPLNSYFYDSISGDRPYSAADFARAFGIILSNGIIPSTVDSALGFGWATNYTTIGAGRATIQGHFIELTDPEILTIPTGSYAGTVVIRVDITDSRIASLAVREDQVPQQDNTIYELPLWNVTVTNGVITSVTDQRTQGGAVAKMPAVLPANYQVATWSADLNGVKVNLGRYNGSGKPVVLFLTSAQPGASAAEHRVWIQIDNF